MFCPVTFYRTLDLSLLIIIFIVAQIKGQPSITFQVDISDLIENGFFSKDLGHRVFVRGSFNDWRGSEYELTESKDPNRYIGKHSLGKIGDTISYKYVIQKGADNDYWETQPNPNNPDNGNRQAVIVRDNQVLTMGHFGYDEYIHYPVVFSKQKLQEDYLQFRNILESTHPALYDYAPKVSLDSIFDKNFDKIDSELDFRTFLILMTEVISNVGCGHSSHCIPNKYWSVAPEKLFPLQLTGANNKIIVRGSYSDVISVPVGSEIIAINGQPVDLVLNRLMLLTSADGFNPSYRHTKSIKNFSVKYSLAFGFFDSYVVEYRESGNKQFKKEIVQPVAKAMIDKSKHKARELSFQIEEKTQTGVLTINSFGYYGEVDMFQSFVDSVFSDIRQNKTENLILDLRGNSGGDPFCAAYLWAYLQPESLPYFQDHYGKYDTLASPIPIPQNSFKGKLFTIIDGNGFSTTGHFCGLLKYHNVGKFIGSELGSTYTCTGNATYPALKNTGIMVGTARVRRYTAAVKDMDPQRGVMPDYNIEPTQEDIINGKDIVKTYTLELTGKK